MFPCVKASLIAENGKKSALLLPLATLRHRIER